MTQVATYIQAEGFFPSERRWLYYRRYCATNKNRGEIIAIHGASEHGGRYHELGSELAQNGYNFYILDLTGYGRSEGRRGYIHRFEDYLVDIANFYAFLKIHKQMQVPFVFGHSLGGLIAVVFTAWAKCPVQGLVLSGPLFRCKIAIPIVKRLTARMMSLFYPSYSLQRIVDPGLLSHDPEIVEEYITDPMVQHHINSRWLVEITRGMKKALLAARHIKVPCLIFHGEKDEITDLEASKQFFAGLTDPRKDFYIIHDAFHEVFNEKGKEALTAKLIEWLGRTKTQNQS